MKGHKTSFVGMFKPQHDTLPAVRLVEIPLIQRDYAQGRLNAEVEAIRSDFLDVLVDAITGGEPIDLDFVYGEINDGVLHPLDGQQRLTTLFLIHWYIASKLGRLTEATPWLKFSYSTRQSAELFCRQLVNPNHPISDDFTSPSAWITDQPWYLFSWRHDPTVQAMLVMVDAIHDRLSASRVDLDSVWNRLVDVAEPPISFHFLPIDDMPSGEGLYIKMNSRGKPLTEFETFKARFEKMLGKSLDPEQFDEIIHKIDGVWTDVLWPYHGGDQIVDDEFLRYLEFVIEICEWRQDGESFGGRLLDRAEHSFGEGKLENLNFLIHAFDTWVDSETGLPLDLEAVFRSHFTTRAEAGNSSSDQVLLFESANANLFEACCRSYGEKRGRSRQFTLSETLYLFAVLIHRRYDTADFQSRLRILRNLTDRADDEVREERMPDLLRATEHLIRTGALGELKGFNQERVLDEIAKERFLAEHPEQLSVIHQLEDHPLLRGRLFAFDLEPTLLAKRAEAFAATTRRDLWPQLTAALLAGGNYGLIVGNRGYQFGSPELERCWREVFTRHGRSRNNALRTILNGVLDAVAAVTDDAGEALQSIASEFVDDRAASLYFDWRYYLVAYDEMREGKTGIYYGEHLGATGYWKYSMCMLRTDSLTGSAYYRDPFLLAIWNKSGVGNSVHDPWFRGYETEPRWLRLRASGGGIRCVSDGFELDAPVDEHDAELFQSVCTTHGAESAKFLKINQVDRQGEAIDSEDRVQRGATLLRSLVEAGL